MNGLTISWPVVIGGIALLAAFGPVCIYIGRWMQRTDALEAQVRKIWERIDERDEKYQVREVRLEEQFAALAVRIDRTGGER
jgi:hypothetical protein